MWGWAHAPTSSNRRFETSVLAWDSSNELDVQCERCKTEYEFDDALVSGRGTTVRCTHCGHQFKVRRTDVGDAAGDRWLVQTANGQQLTFLTLRELQRAILAKQVSRNDMLLLGGGPVRLLGSIAELDPFFEGRSSSRPPPAGDDGNHGGPAIPRPGAQTKPFGATADGQPAAYAPQPPAAFFDAPTRKFEPARHMAPAMPAGPSTELMQEPRAAFPPPTVPVRRAMPRAGDDLLDVNDMQVAFPPSSEDPYDIPRRRRVGGWVVAFVLLLAVGVVGWVLAKPYLVARNAPSGPRLDTRAQGYLAEGERAMADGDLQAAQQAFDKASVLAEHDVRVLVDEARVAAANADISWLKLRVLSPDSADELRATKAPFDDWVTRARKASDEALSLAPDDYGAVRVKIDVLRLQGARDAARGYISKLGPLGGQPETAYVLAALDLAEPEPFWTTVIDRLRLAASAENGAGRARAALVYAMAKSGDVAGAKGELARLDAQPRPYPLLPSLHAFVDKIPPKAAADAGAAAATAATPRVDVSALPAVSPPSTPGAATVSTDHERDNTGGDQSGGMHAASAAIKKGEWAHARQIYEALVARNPTDSEALSGIGDVERSQGNSAGAIAAYKRVLTINPSYLPALLGLADTQWASGDQAGARRSYKDIVDRFPEGTYPAYVRGRVEPVESTPAAAAPPAASAGSKATDPGGN
jgi:predicted Zn finger-like uncharacterized protein